MRRAALLLVFVLLASSSAAVRAQPAVVELETRVFEVRYRPVEDVVLLVRPLLGEQGSLILQGRLKAVTVIDEPERLRHIADVVRAFDVPPRHVNLAIQLLMGSQGKIDPEARAPGRLPGINRTVWNTLEKHTRWTDYRLLGSASFTVAEGEESQLSLGTEYRIRFVVGSVDPVMGVTRFQRFLLERRQLGDGGVEEYRPIWNQALNLKDDQLYVFGATRMENSNRAVFLSITSAIVR